jgi:DNA-binding transcriptional ArsR family regulator
MVPFALPIGTQRVFDIYEFLNIITSVRRAPAVGELQAFKAQFFKALAHPIRIRIVELLVERERGVQELQGALGLDQATVSQHLAVLRMKDIVTARKEGTMVRYVVKDSLVRSLLAVARRIFSNQLIGTQGMLRELQREARRR